MFRFTAVSVNYYTLFIVMYKCLHTNGADNVVYHICVVGDQTERELGEIEHLNLISVWTFHLYSVATNSVVKKTYYFHLIATIESPDIKKLKFLYLNNTKSY